MVTTSSDRYWNKLKTASLTARTRWLHVNDIFFPFDYRRDWVLGELRFWTEQYLLQPFLSFNSEFEVLMGNSYLAHYHMEDFKAPDEFTMVQTLPLSLRFLLQQRYEVEAAAKDEIRRLRIKVELPLCLNRPDPDPVVNLAPLRFGKIMVGKGDAVMDVTNPIHQPQRRPGKNTIPEVIFQQNVSPRHPGRFAQQCSRTFRVMQHVNQHHHVEAGVLERNRCAIVFSNWNMRVRPQQDIYAGGFHPAPSSCDEFRDLPVSAANVE
jgi:hypothetical protein